MAIVICHLIVLPSQLAPQYYKSHCIYILFFSSLLSILDPPVASLKCEWRLLQRLRQLLLTFWWQPQMPLKQLHQLRSVSTIYSTVRYVTISMSDSSHSKGYYAFLCLLLTILPTALPFPFYPLRLRYFGFCHQCCCGHCYRCCGHLSCSHYHSKWVTALL